MRGDFNIGDEKEMKELQAAYDDAVKRNLHEFQFQGIPVLTDYVKYVLMYSKMIRNKGKKKLTTTMK